MAELLAPAGSLDSLRAAVNAGADAVYIGGSRFGARAYADNPGTEDLLRGIEFCHLRGKKVYLTVNTLFKEEELFGELIPWLVPYYDNGVDALIVQDLGAVRLLHEVFPDLKLHASTQMSITSPEGAALLGRHGVTRIVPARELTLPEIRALICETGLEAETFIHGALCYSYSGRCLFSSLLGGRSGNRGRCAQPCRLPYTLEGAKNPPAYLLSTKDLCTLDILPDLEEAGIASFKIEGRMKRPEYTAGVVEIYRKYLDLYKREGRGGYRVSEEDRGVLLDLYNRGGFSGGYYQTKPGPAMMGVSRPNHQGTKAAVRKGGKAVALETLHAGDVLESDSGGEMVLTQNVTKGESFSLTVKDASEAGTVFYRTKNASLLQELAKRRLGTDSKVKIKGRLRISADSPAILSVWLCGFGEGKGLAFEASGAAAVLARTSAISAEEARRQIQKTGGTPFEFDSLDVVMEDGLFLPVQALNRLRREALAGLQERILTERRRRKAPDTDADSLTEKADQDGSVSLFTGVHREDGCELFRFGCPEEADRDDSASLFTGAHREDGCGFFRSGHPEKAVRRAESSLRTQEPENLSRPLSWQMTVLVMTPEQLCAAASAAERYPGRIDTVYLDAQLWFSALFYENNTVRQSILRLKRHEVRVLLACPPVLRSRDKARFLKAWEEKERCGAVWQEAENTKPCADSFSSPDPAAAFLFAADGFLIQTLDQLALLQKLCREEPDAGYLLAAEDSLYTMNTAAVQFLSGEGAVRLTLPAELNYRELCQLAGRENFRRRELPVYGRQPLMQSAQCLRKNTAGCTGMPGFLFLKDRMGARFPVLNRCNVCCNTVYNSVPLDLTDCQKELRRLSPGFLRLSFCVETGEETLAVLKKCAELFPGSRTAEKRKAAAPENETPARSDSSAGQGCSLPERGKKERNSRNGRSGAKQERFAGTRGHFRRGVE